MAFSASKVEEAVSTIASDWQEAGVPAPVTPAPWQSRCDVTSCAGLTFVEIRTRAGARCVCFKHYEAIRAATNHPRHGRARS
jgi:hypothetical protein